MQKFNDGHGVDGVLICAGTSSNEPIDLSGKVTREKGRVIVVGAVNMNIPRDDYFKKKLALLFQDHMDLADMMLHMKKMGTIILMVM